MTVKPFDLRDAVRGLMVIPACPLALTADRHLDERRQRALVRYYLAAGATGLAVGVHTTQFAIRDPQVGLFRPVLELVAEELRRSDRRVVRIAGACGPTAQAAAEAETARDLANALLLNQGFEELTKKSLLARFIKIFPSIQSLVAADAEGKEEQLLVSRESYERKREEYETIVSKKIPENSKAIATAREHGDLKENSEYKMAKQDQQVLMAQKALLEKDLGRARITDFKEAAADQVSVGSIVDVKAGGKTTRYTILGAWDSVPDKNIISYKTPLGLALLSKKVGDTVKVKIGNSEESYTVVSIARYADA